MWETYIRGLYVSMQRFSYYRDKTIPIFLNNQTILVISKGETVKIKKNTNIEKRFVTESIAVRE